MKQSIFAIYDSKAEAYLPPFIAITVNVAKRMFEQAANNEESDFARWSADYTLFELGTWDDATGVVEMHRAQLSHGLAQAYINNDQARPVETPERALRPVQGGE